MEAKTIFKTLDRIDSLPTLPAIAIEVNRMLLDFETSVNQLSGCIEKDPAMVSKMLKLVNSAFFGLKGRISTISHAVIILGFNTIRNAVVSISIIDVFCTNKFFDGFDIKQFWKHSVAVAVTSKYLADKTRIHPADDCFFGGLLHDMGKIVLVQYFNDLFQKVWLAIKDGGQSFYEAEKSQIPVDHAQIGGYLAQKWQLPAGLVDAIRCHHVVRPDATDQNLLMIIHAADIIVNTYGADSKGNLELSNIHPDVLKVMGSQFDTISEWYPAVSLEIESACKFFLEESKL
ncbi:MAG: HDOD domain-containing protein [Desulfobacterales bacterium]|nr:HDOD domain-containing protein [Desulfobacterales bacterium]